MSQKAIDIKIGGEKIKGGDLDLNKLESQIIAYNESKHLEGLEDQLNPELLDFANVKAFLSFVASHESEISSFLGKKPLYLNNPMLPLSMVHPVTIESFNDAEILDTDPEAIMYEKWIEVPTDLKMARSKFKKASERFEHFHQVVTSNEEKLDGLEDPKEIQKMMDDLMFMKHRRFRALKTMEINARVLLAKDDDFEKESLVEIEDLLQDYEVPPLNNF